MLLDDLTQFLAWEAYPSHCLNNRSDNTKICLPQVRDDMLLGFDYREDTYGGVISATCTCTRHNCSRIRRIEDGMDEIRRGYADEIRRGYAEVSYPDEDRYHPDDPNGYRRDVQMMYDFRFSGGLKNGTFHSEGEFVTKFLLFGIVDKEEIPIWTAQKVGLVQYNPYVDGPANIRDALNGSYVPDRYTTDIAAWKLFMYYSKGGLSKHILSLYFVLGEFEPKAVYTIKPFKHRPDNFYLTFTGRLPKKSEVVNDILDPKSQSAFYYKRQLLPSKQTLRDIITREVTLPPPPPPRRFIVV